MLKYYLGQMTEDDLMAAAADPDPETHVGRACEVNFYVGENALAHQKRTTALARFHAVQSSCIKDYVEYGGALADLKARDGGSGDASKTCDCAGRHETHGIGPGEGCDYAGQHRLPDLSTSTITARRPRPSRRARDSGLPAGLTLPGG